MIFVTQPIVAHYLKKESLQFFLVLTLLFPLHQVSTDPITGQTKTKKKLGGAYPGQRRPNQMPYVPDSGAFDSTGTAKVHFKAYGGGNALTLVRQDGSSQPASGIPVATPAQYIEVTLPDGVVEGQTIHVQAPDGKVNAIVVPPGFGPGSTFTVEFAPEEEAPPPPTTSSYSAPAATAAAAPPPPAGDDGFASGFNNPNYMPPTANATTDFSGSYAHSGTQATPIYK